MVPQGDHIEPLPTNDWDWMVRLGRRDNFTSGKNQIDLLVEKVNEVIARVNETSAVPLTDGGDK